ncbi:C2H2 type zinc-finger-domain-containing protein [Limtongia smithiae]|uniref:C2H2 type zinc-finger-domain-containing protein n=1 Tax=Limtongia smithiae TaxID=1125753 RepID=UPI0034CEDB40
MISAGAVQTSFVAPMPEACIASAPLFTCNSCGVGFATPDLQRRHMKTDWHRYNLKRRVATLPPISAEIFAERVLQQMDISRESAERAAYMAVCKVCGNKKFTSAGAYENHLLSARHKSNAESTAEGDVGAVSAPRQLATAAARTRGLLDGMNAASSKVVADDQSGAAHLLSFKSTRVAGAGGKKNKKHQTKRALKISVAGFPAPLTATSSSSATKREDEDEDDADDVDIEEDIDAIIAERLQNALRLPVTDCIFCPAHFEEIDTNIVHMQKDHGMFLPEPNYIVDIEGLVTYLSEKVTIGNACLYCSFVGRSLNSVRDHMLAKQHCKIPYDSEDDQLEISDFYDFTSTYSDEDGGDWEEISGDEEDDGTSTVASRRPVVEDQLILDESGLELILPKSGMRIGHRSLARYYRQSFRPTEPTRDGQSTVVAASSGGRQMLLPQHQQPLDRIQVQVQRKNWRDVRVQQTKDIRREQRYVNQQKHFRDPMLGG